MRYSRQVALIGKQAQNKLSKKTVTILGLGALGSNIANLLARAGINLKLIDFDIVDLTNLQRQALYSEEDINKPKVIAAKERLSKINSEINIQIFNEKLTESNLKILNSDLIIDCTDNLTARFLLNDYCYNKIPWIHTAAIKYTGVVYFILPKKPCLKCIYSKNTDIDNCQELGVLNTITALIASIASTQAINFLTNNKTEESMIRFNIQENKLEKIKVTRRCKKCLKLS